MPRFSPSFTSSSYQFADENVYVISALWLLHFPIQSFSLCVMSVMWVGLITPSASDVKAMCDECFELLPPPVAANTVYTVIRFSPGTEARAIGHARKLTDVLIGDKQTDTANPYDPDADIMPGVWSLRDFDQAIEADVFTDEEKHKTRIPTCIARRRAHVNHNEECDVDVIRRGMFDLSRWDEWFTYCCLAVDAYQHVTSFCAFRELDSLAEVTVSWATKLFQCVINMLRLIPGLGDKDRLYQSTEKMIVSTEFLIFRAVSAVLCYVRDVAATAVGAPPQMDASRRAYVHNALARAVHEMFSHRVVWNAFLNVHNRLFLLTRPQPRAV